MEQLRNLPSPSSYSSWQEWARAMIGKVETPVLIVPTQLPVYPSGDEPAANEDGMLAIIDGKLKFSYGGVWKEVSTV